MPVMTVQVNATTVLQPVFKRMMLKQWQNVSSWIDIVLISAVWLPALWHEPMALWVKIMPANYVVFAPRFVKNVEQNATVINQSTVKIVQKLVKDALKNAERWPLERVAAVQEDILFEVHPFGNSFYRIRP